MAKYGVIRRPSTSSAPGSTPSDDDLKGSTEKGLVCSFKFIWPFSIPPTPEAAAARIIRNLGIFALYYAQFVWITLFITLIPKRKVSLIYLVIMKEITLMYLLLLQALPNSVLLQKIVDRRIVLFLLCLITANMMILTRAAIHLAASLGGTIPIILVHAFFWRSENNVSVNEEGSDAEELVQLVENKDGDAEPLDVV